MSIFGRTAWSTRPLLSAGVVLGLALLVVHAASVSGYPQSGKKPATPVVCSDCHSCDRPTSIHLCLKKSTCLRHKAMEDLSPDEGPGTIILDALENQYVPVVFNHRAHAKMVELDNGCETCHHYTPPDSDHPACRECHPTDIEHEDIVQPGLKGAYHRNCLGCHSEWDSDTSCEVCHARKGTPEAAHVREHSSYKPITMKELIIFKTDYAEGDEVPFHHRNHSELYERDCNECHQEQSCARCHVQGKELHPMGNLEDVDLHDTCFKCHSGQDCSECHGRDPDDLFTHADTGWPLKSYHQELTCRNCHGHYGAFQKLKPVCANCHPDGWGPDFNHSKTGVTLGETHGEFECETCHVDGPGKGASCDACHDDGRAYSKATGFGG